MAKHTDSTLSDSRERSVYRHMAIACMMGMEKADETIRSLSEKTGVSPSRIKGILCADPVKATIKDIAAIEVALSVTLLEINTPEEPYDYTRIA